LLAYLVLIFRQAILSKRLTIYCGQHRIPWDDLSLAASNIEARYEVFGNALCKYFIPENEIAKAIHFNLLELNKWRSAFHLNQYEVSFASLIYETWTFVSTDPRDKIYGIFGLLKAFPTTKHIIQDWRADYSLSPSQVFAKVTAMLIEQTKSLQILSCVQDRRLSRVPNLPSWSPDYSIPYFNMMSTIFNAAGGAPFRSSATPTSQPWNRLRISGAHFDTILATGNPRTRYTNSLFLLDPSWFELCLMLPQPYHTGESRNEALWRTLCANQDANNNTPAPKSFGPLFRDFVAAMVMVASELEAEVCERNEQDRYVGGQYCMPSFSEALNYTENFWKKWGLDGYSKKDLVREFGGTQKVMASDAQLWLIFTLFKLQLLAVTNAIEDSAAEGTNDGSSERAEESIDIPDFEYLKCWDKEPGFKLRKVDGEQKTALTPPQPDFVHSYQMRYGTRKLFVTKKGYLGLGPASVEVEDEVWLFAGGGAAFVLNRHNAEHNEQTQEDLPLFNLVGESYVHGIMDGEAIQPGKLEMMDIELE
jgi:hypothetical protein